MHVNTYIPYVACTPPPPARCDWGDAAKWWHPAADKAFPLGGSQQTAGWASGWKTACRISRLTPDGKSENLNRKFPRLAVKLDSELAFLGCHPYLVFKLSLPAALPLLENLTQLVQSSMVEVEDLVLALSAGNHQLATGARLIAATARERMRKTRHRSNRPFF